VEDPLPPAVPVARMAEGSLLELPFVRSGDRVYADVRIALTPAGGWRVQSAREIPVSEDSRVDGVIAPAESLAQLEIAALPANLHVRRLHIGERVYDSVTIAFDATHWSYASTPVEATALTAADFANNDKLQAEEKHTLVIESRPGLDAQVFPMRLQAKAYRLCAEAQEEGGDELALEDADGRRVLTVRGGEGCAEAVLAAGSYKLRHTYGGKGSARVLFVRPGPAAQFKAAAPRPAWAPQVAAAAGDYWAFSSSFNGQSGYLAMGGYTSNSETGDWPSPYELGWSGRAYDGPPFWWTGTCFSWFGLQTDAAWDQTFQSASGLMQGLNLFRIDQDNEGNYRLGPALACNPNTPLAYSSPEYGSGVWLNNPADYYDSSSLGHPRESNPPLLRGLAAPALGSTFNLVLPSLYVYDLYWLGFNAGASTMDGFDSGDNGLATLDTAASRSGPVDPAHQVFQVVMQYKPAGLLASQLAKGEAAFFPYADCSGPAVVVNSRMGKLGAPSFTNDRATNTGYQQGKYVIVGPGTHLTLYEGPDWTGNTQVVFQSTCQPVTIAMQSLETTIDPTVISAGQTCNQCNLGSINLAGLDLHGVNLSDTNLTHADLSNTNLAGADLHDAILDSALLFKANLDGANLCGASLAPAAVTAAETATSADLHGAFLRNANLQSANLTRANLAKASFFGAGTAACTAAAACGAGPSTCPNARSATLLQTNFASAYLAFADFSGAKGSATFTGAMLPGAFFNDAHLTSPTDFTGAFLVGATFTDADPGGISGLDSAIATTSNGSCAFKLDTNYTSFKNYKVKSGTSCAAAAAGPTCTFVVYNASPALPPGATAWASPANDVGTCGHGVCTAPAMNTCFQPVGGS
jgi:uncharacterized protein YjbI with pentapeptide repeats